MPKVERQGTGRRTFNRDSMCFHSKMGFTEVGRFHNSGFKFNKWYDMIWMEKIIGSHDAQPGEVRFGAWDIKK